MMETMYFVEGDDGFVWVLVFKKMYKMLLTFVTVDWGWNKMWKKKKIKSNQIFSLFLLHLKWFIIWKDIKFWAKKEKERFIFLILF